MSSIKNFKNFINESNINNKDKLISKIKEIIKFLGDEFIIKFGLGENDYIDEVQCNGYESFVFKEFYEKLGIDIDFKIHTENDTSFKFNGFYDEHGDRNFTLYDSNGGFHNDVSYYEFKDITEESLWKIINLLIAVPSVSIFLNKDVFKKINEAIDLYKINIDELINTREGFDLFIKWVEKEGGTVRHTTLHGYEFEFFGGEYRNLLEIWRTKFFINYNIGKVTNTDHPDYGKVYYHFNLFRDPEKFHDNSEVFKKLNK
tara:strand:+ start:27959 stop:28735 length:777 start_codon:yes stop_codon:yes gene_type:complete